MSYSLEGIMPGDQGIKQTLNRMIGAVRWTIQNYSIRRRAERIVANCMERDELCEVSSIFKWVLKHYRFVKDPRFLEMFKAPDAVDQEIDAVGVFQGDCDDVSGYLAALLMSLGYQVKFVVISVRGKGEDFRHVYPMVYLSKARRWMALEATARNNPPGWEAPQGDRRFEIMV